MIRQVKVLAIVIAVLHGQSVRAQEEPLFEKMQQMLTSEAFKLGVLLQVVADFEESPKGNNGFSIANMRLRLSGNLDGGFGYMVQTNFVTSPAVLDAVFSYSVSRAFTVDAGLFKAPFSKEYLMSAASIDFVNRSQVVSALRPGRQIGVQFKGTTGLVSYRAGLFNGNGRVNGNNDNAFMYVGRVAITPHIGPEESPEELMEVGVNAAYDKVSPSQDMPPAEERKVLVGADVRVAYAGVLLSAEVIVGNIQPRAGMYRPFGYHATAGYRISAVGQVLLRWDSYDPKVLRKSDQIVAGFNLWPTSVTELQVNLVMPVNSRKEGLQLLVNAQVGF